MVANKGGACVNYSVWVAMMVVMAAAAAAISIEDMMITGAEGQLESGAEAPAADASGGEVDDCSTAMEDLSACNATSIKAATPAPECCEALRSVGPQCMCSVFLGPAIPGAAQQLNISRDQALLLPRNCNLPRIRCTAPPSPSSSAASSRATTSLRPSTSSFFLGADDDAAATDDVDDDPEQLTGNWLQQEKEGGY